MNSKNKNEISHTITQAYHGPIPPSVEMKAYAEISKDFPEKIIEMAMLEQRNRIELSKLEQKHSDRELEINASLIRLGVFAALLSILLIMGTAVACAYLGHPVVSGIIGTGGIALIVSVIVNGSRIPRK